MDQNIKAKNLLLYVFLGVYTLTALGTLSMLFLGAGSVRDSERSLLITTFLVESAVAISALFYSLWNIKSTTDKSIDHTKELIVNPLEDSFKDLVIPVECLRLPLVQLHENKHFKRCKFIGPASLMLMGGAVKNSKFIECGDIIPIPAGTFSTGVVALKNCIIEDCEFIRVTFLLEHNEAKSMALQVPNSKLAGS